MPLPSLNANTSSSAKSGDVTLGAVHINNGGSGGGGGVNNWILIALAIGIAMLFWKKT